MKQGGCLKDSHVRVLLEDIDHKFKTIQERIADIGVIKEKIENIVNNVRIIKKDIVVIKMSSSV